MPLCWSGLWPVCVLTFRTPVRRPRPSKACTFAKPTSTWGTSSSSTSASPSAATTAALAAVLRWGPSERGITLTAAVMTFLGHLWIKDETKSSNLSSSEGGQSYPASELWGMVWKHLWCFLFSGQTARLDPGTLAQEECRVPPAHAQECREQRWAEGEVMRRWGANGCSKQTERWTPWNTLLYWKDRYQFSLKVTPVCLQL